MKVRMEATEGLGRLAEVLVDGNTLFVCDGISPADKRTPPGVLESIRFGYNTEGGIAWDAATAGNVDRKLALEHLRDWSYTGFGRVVQIMPVVIDFGLLQMEDSTWTNDERLVGQFVEIPIDKLEILPEGSSDWPEDLR